MQVITGDLHPSGQLAFGQWQLRQLRSELRAYVPKAGVTPRREPVVVSYLSQLYLSPRFADARSACYLEPEMRFEQLTSVILHFLGGAAHGSGGQGGCASEASYIRAPAGSGGRVGAPPLEGRAWAWRQGAA